jgi:hypothetical protein
MALGWTLAAVWMSFSTTTNGSLTLVSLLLGILHYLLILAPPCIFYALVPKLKAAHRQQARRESVKGWID